MTTLPQTTLGPGGRTTSRLGFGGSALMGAISEKESLRLLETAFDAGIRHFDVAPAYGYGAAEACLGKFLKGRRDEVTVTTKFGLEAPADRAALSFARRIAAPLVARMPGLKAQLGRMRGQLRPKAPVEKAASAAARFTVERARESLKRSLAELQTDRLDLWLLHEATAEELGDERLLEFLRETRAHGVIGNFGVGGEAAKMPALYAERRAYCPVLQHEWSAYDAPVDFPGTYRIHHRALSDRLSELVAYLRKNRGVCREWSDATGQDLSSPGVLPALLLKVALVRNPESVILVSSRRPAHIAANAQTAADPALDSSALRFHALIQQWLSESCNYVRSV